MGCRYNLLSALPKAEGFQKLGSNKMKHNLTQVDSLPIGDGVEILVVGTMMVCPFSSSAMLVISDPTPTT
jgi:hypothetical protein